MYECVCVLLCVLSCSASLCASHQLTCFNLQYTLNNFLNYKYFDSILLYFFYASCCCDWSRSRAGCYAEWVSLSGRAWDVEISWQRIVSRRCVHHLEFTRYVRPFPCHPPLLCPPCVPTVPSGTFLNGCFHPSPKSTFFPKKGHLSVPYSVGCSAATYARHPVGPPAASSSHIVFYFILFIY